LLYTVACKITHSVLVISNTAFNRRSTSIYTVSALSHVCLLLRIFRIHCHWYINSYNANKKCAVLKSTSEINVAFCCIAI